MSLVIMFFDNMPNIEVTDIEFTINSIVISKLKTPLVVTFKAFLLIMMFYKGYNMMMYFKKLF